MAIHGMSARFQKYRARGADQGAHQDQRPSKKRVWSFSAASPAQDCDAANDHQ